MKDWIIVDLDRTLCDASHRAHLAQAGQWDEYHAGISGDATREDIEKALRAICTHYYILLCSQRDERYRTATQQWLIDHDIDSIVDEILMRPTGNFDPEDKLKVWLVDEFFEGRDKALESVICVLENREQVVLAFRDAGYRCWQTSAGEY